MCPICIYTLFLFCFFYTLFYYYLHEFPAFTFLHFKNTFKYNVSNCIHFIPVLINIAVMLEAVVSDCGCVCLNTWPVAGVSPAPFHWSTPCVLQAAAGKLSVDGLQQRSDSELQDTMRRLSSEDRSRLTSALSCLKSAEEAGKHGPRCELQRGCS